MRGRHLVTLFSFGVMATACGALPARLLPTPSQVSPTVPSPAVQQGSPSPVGQSVVADRPAPRAGAALVFDPVSHQLLLTGGIPDPLNPPAGGASVGHDFWAWRKSGGWTQITTTVVPDSGYYASMVWDPSTQRVVLFTNSGAVWQWDGQAWAAFPAGSAGPEVVSGVSAAYDSAHSQILALGQPFIPEPGPVATGARLNSPSQNMVPLSPSLEAMWLWDGSSWTAQPTPMSWRDEPAVAFDEAHGQLVVYGGYGDADTTTWIWDGTSWTGRQTPVFPIANQSAAAYDSARHEVVVFAPGGETWTWDGGAWALQSSSGPGIRRDMSMAYDSDLGEVVLYGGKTPVGSGEVYLSDLWAWNGSAWTQIG